MNNLLTFFENHTKGCKKTTLCDKIKMQKIYGYVQQDMKTFPNIQNTPNRCMRYI